MSRPKPSGRRASCWWIINSPRLVRVGSAGEAIQSMRSSFERAPSLSRCLASNLVPPQEKELTHIARIPERWHRTDPLEMNMPGRVDPRVAHRPSFAERRCSPLLVGQTPQERGKILLLSNDLSQQNRLVSHVTSSSPELLQRCERIRDVHMLLRLVHTACRVSAVQPCPMPAKWGTLGSLWKWKKRTSRSR